MRHSLAQLLAASSSSCRGSPREPTAACSLLSEGTSGRSSPGEAGDEAEPRLEKAVAAADSLENDDDDELLFPAGLELGDWLEAAVAAEARPDWEIEEEEGGSPRPEAGPAPGRGLARPGSNRLKAAAAARLNRQKKKQYVMGLETRLQGLAAENRQLRDRNRGLGRRVRHLERETSYLRAVLANQSALGRLLSRLAGDGAGKVGLRISTSLFEDHHAAVAARLETRLPCEGGSGGGDHDYALPVRKDEEEDDGDKRAGSSSPGGICLHVDRDQVSVEFCSVCARRAATSAFAAASISPSSFAAKIFSFRCLPCQAPLCRG
ncbi:CREB/ATF bZIP transcription factor [Hemicordylus capensis]|uniref:CREB/ATF bZIP transcription factor n=1 Tax=Hemicordylus capensis TaxID=884348 RepID=UPI002303617E|nr:CREB/ATF bZIP transcription factor [Hemicordylus capensis]